MEQNNHSNKQTPARRGRGGKSRGRKNYASEGDALTEMPTPASFPATPMKSINGSPAPGTQPANSKSTTKKNNRKPRPNNVSTSPGPTKANQRTPPPSASATVSSVAFASSSSFHSPAPDTLPRPAFSKITRSQTFASADGETFVRARSESVVVQSAKEPSPPASDCESPTPAQPALLVRNDTHESPLEFLFQAKLAEKERLRRANSANATADVDGPFSAPPGFRHPSAPGLDDNPIPLKFPSRPAQRGVSDNTGTTERGVWPGNFAMPVHERIQAAGPARSHLLQPSPQSRQNHAAQEHPHLATPPQLDKSEQMKRLLGIGGSTPTKPATASLQAHHNTSAPALLSNAPPSNAQTSGRLAAGSSPGGADRKNHVENALRQALKLPWSVSSGFDGNHSPQPQAGRFPGQT